MATEAQLTRLGGVGPGEVPAALRGHRGAAPSKLLTAVQLAVLGARATGAAAGCPLASLPAASGAKVEGGWDSWGAGYALGVWVPRGGPGCLWTATPSNLTLSLQPGAQGADKVPDSQGVAQGGWRNICLPHPSPWAILTMEGRGGRGKVPGRPGVWPPRHSCALLMPLLTHERHRGK